MDSTSTISNVVLIREKIPTRRFPNNADVLSTMQAAQYVISRFALIHVKSHQDEKTDFDDLPFPAQLNVQCDHMATAQLERQLTTNEWECTNPNPFTPRNLAVEMAFGSQIISSHYISRLREAICLDRHKLFLQSKYRWDNTTWDSIDWEAFASCARRPTLENNTNRSKLVHNWLKLTKSGMTP